MLLYCSAYYVVSNRFFKKGCELFSSFFPPRISFHTMCVSSLLNFDPPVLPCPSIQSQIHFWTPWTNRHFHPPAIWHTPLTVVSGQPQLICTLFFLFCFGVFLQTEHEDSPLRCRVQLGCFSRWFVYTLWVQCWIFLISISVDYCSIFC